MAETLQEKPMKEIARVEPERRAITPMEMLQIAVERNADLDQLQKLMDLQERWERTEARKAFVVALGKFKADPPTVLKSRSASFGQGKTAYTYANLANAAAVIATALSHYGLSHRWSVEQNDAGIAVTCTLTHEQGHSESVTMRAPADTSGSKNSIQAIGSTVTYLSRYSLLAITGLAASDQDDDGFLAGASEFISPEQKDQLIARMRDIPNLDTAAFLKYMGVATIDSLPANQFDRAIASLERKKRSATS